LGLKLGQSLLLGGTPESVATDFNKPFGQDVLEEAANELMGGEGQVAHSLRAIIAIAKGDVPLMEHLQTAVD